MTARERASVVAILVVVAVFYVMTLRQGHIWADDFAMYIHHAMNLAEGRPYGDTGYIYNAEEPYFGPPAYPPVLPVILVPVYRFFGLNFQAMKVVLTGFSMLGLLTIYILARRELPHLWAVVLVLMVGLNPVAWNMKDQILSDHVFSVFVYLAILLIQRAYREEKPTSIWRATGLGVVMYLAYGTRTLGLVLVPALVVYDLIRQVREDQRWWPSPFAIAASTVTMFLAGAQAAWLRTASGYAGLFDFSPIWWLRNTISYTRSIREFWINGFSNPLSYLIYVVAGTLFVWGIWRTARKRFGILETFTLLYLSVLLCYSLPGVYRYLLPVIPVYLLYVLTGVREITARLSRGGKAVALTAAALAVVITYGGAYERESWGAIREGVGDAQFMMMAAYIRRHAEPSAVFVARRPRLLSLETGRPAALYPMSANPAGMEAFVGRIGARYALLAQIPDVDFESDQTSLAPYLEQPGSGWREIYRIGPYRLFYR